MHVHDLEQELDSNVLQRMMRRHCSLARFVVLCVMNESMATANTYFLDNMGDKHSEAIFDSGDAPFGKLLLLDNDIFEVKTFADETLLGNRDFDDHLVGQLCR